MDVSIEDNILTVLFSNEVLCGSFNTLQIRYDWESAKQGKFYNVNVKITCLPFTPPEQPQSLAP